MAYVLLAMASRRVNNICAHDREKEDQVGGEREASRTSQ